MIVTFQYTCLVLLSCSDSASVALGISEKANNNVIASYTVMISTILNYIVAKIIRTSSGAFLLEGSFTYNRAYIQIQYLKTTEYKRRPFWGAITPCSAFP